MASSSIPASSVIAVASAIGAGDPAAGAGGLVHPDTPGIIIENPTPITTIDSAGVTYTVLIAQTSGYYKNTSYKSGQWIPAAATSDPTAGLTTSAPERPTSSVSSTPATSSLPASAPGSSSSTASKTLSPGAISGTEQPTILTSATYYYLATPASRKLAARQVSSSLSYVSVGTPTVLVYSPDGSSTITMFHANVTYSVPGLASLTTSEVTGTAFPTNLLTTPKPRETGLSSAAGAGIGIGSAILGALIALGVFFLCFRGRNGWRSKSLRRGGGHGSKVDSYGMTDVKSLGVATSGQTFTIPHECAAAVVYSNKPQPRDDNSITDELSRLKSRIDGHVATYYSRSGGSEKPALDAFAHLWAKRSPVPLSQLPGLLSNSRSRSHVLRAAIAWIVTKRIFPGGVVDESFLPGSIASAYADLSSNRMDQQTRSAFLSEWRVITAALSNTLHGQDILAADDARSRAVQVALRQADQFLAPLAISSENDARLRNLEEIFKRAARLGWTLFSQPCEYEVDWAVGSRGGMVAWPGVLKVTDDNGKVLTRARVFAQKEVVGA